MNQLPDIGKLYLIEKLDWNQELDVQMICKCIGWHINTTTSGAEYTLYHFKVIMSNAKYPVGFIWQFDLDEILKDEYLIIKPLKE